MAEPATLASLDLKSLAQYYQTGAGTPSTLMPALCRRLEAGDDTAIWICLLPHKALQAQARAVEERRANGERLPLYGIPFAVKDNIDVAGYPTTAACPAFSYTPVKSAPVVERLLDAGAILVGKTNLDQFASGLAGDRTPYGACRNPFDRSYISGGSSAGSAVAVAAGLVSFALGTDTAGSGRVPAGCCNIVGLKPAVGALSTEGVVPSCCSLDCVSILALTVDDAHRVYEVTRGHSASSSDDIAEAPFITSFATPRDEDLDFHGDADQANLFWQAMARLEERGVHRVSVPFAPFREVARLLYEGPWLAERLAGVSDFVQTRADQLHPITRRVLEGGMRYSAVDVFKAMERLKGLRTACSKALAQAEVLIVPTMPTVPTLAAVAADSVSWSRRLGTYTNFANLLGLAAVAVPSGFTPYRLPAGITLLGPAGSERRLCELGMTWQRLANLPLGATGLPLPAPGTSAGQNTTGPVADGWVRVAVAGAHLRGQPLHPELLRTGARFVRACRTAAHYRFVAFMDLVPPRPGLLRDEERAGTAQVEIYDLPMEGFGRLVASVAPPLAIGTIELADGETVKGFLCESWPARTARDITDFGGWTAFREHVAQADAAPATISKIAPGMRRREPVGKDS